MLNYYIGIGLVIFLVFYVLYTLPIDKNTKIVGIISAISSIAIIITIIQAYRDYKFNVMAQVVNYSTEAWSKITSEMDDEFYKYIYGGSLGSLTAKRHKVWSQIATQMESLNKLNGFTKRNFNFFGDTGARIMFWYWINDKEFQEYWETDKDSFDEDTHLLVNYFLNISYENNLKLAEKERQDYRKENSDNVKTIEDIIKKNNIPVKGGYCPEDKYQYGGYRKYGELDGGLCCDDEPKNYNAFNETFTDCDKPFVKF